MNKGRRHSGCREVSRIFPFLAQQGDGVGEVCVRITGQIGQGKLHQLRYHFLVAFERYSVKCPDTDMTMTEAYQDRGSGGRRLITARQFLAGLDQREGLAGVHAQRFQHFRGQYLADAALQSQPTVAKTAVGRPSRSFGAKVKQPTRAIAKLREKKAPAVADIGIIDMELMTMISERQRFFERICQWLELRSEEHTSE